jgi:hypothetical protein
MPPCGHTSAAQCANINRELQRTQDESLAAFLTGQNQNVPPALHCQNAEAELEVLDGDEQHVGQRRNETDLGIDNMVSTM